MSRDLPDHQGFRAILVLWDHWDHKEIKESRDLRDLLALQVNKVQRDLKDLLDLKVNRDYRVQLDRKVLRATLGQWDQWDHQGCRDLKVSKGLRELLVLRARLDP